MLQLPADTSAVQPENEQDKKKARKRTHDSSKCASCRSVCRSQQLFSGRLAGPRTDADQNAGAHNAYDRIHDLLKDLGDRSRDHGAKPLEISADDRHHCHDQQSRGQHPECIHTQRGTHRISGDRACPEKDRQ